MNNFNYIDIHSHFNLPQFDTEREEAIARMTEKGVGTICVGTGLEASQKAIEIAEANENIWATVGLHPTDLPENFNIEIFKQIAKHEKVVAIGECGLDYFRDKNEELIKKQKEIFKQFVELAIEVNRPLMIHARPSKGTMDAYLDVLEILDDYRLKTVDYRLSANFHFFVGDFSIAKQVLERGFTMSFDGPITFARDYDEVIKFLPLESIMAETDSPFAAPAPYRGKKCEPWMVEEVYKKIAEIKGLDVEEVRKQLLINTQKSFNLPYLI